MLSRIGNRVYWLGRYLERAEFLARYTNVHYMHFMDAPATQGKDSALQSVLHVAEVHERYFSAHTRLKAEDVFRFISVDEANPESVLAHIVRVREYASGARDALTPEMWEYINCFYHELVSYSASRLPQEGIEVFARKVAANASMIKGYLHSRMLRNEGWTLLSLGIYLESARLVSQSLRYRMQTLAAQADAGQPGPPESPQLALLLESIGTYEMFKQMYQEKAGRKLALDFLVKNPAYPKSLRYSFARIQTLLSSIGHLRPEAADALGSKSHSLLEKCQAFVPGEEAGPAVAFLEESVTALTNLAGQLENAYLE
jgi:uncharacterized alpha-E superfamily protein